MQDTTKDVNPKNQTSSEVANVEPPLSKAQGSTSEIYAIAIDDFLNCTFPPRDNILAPWLPTQGLCMIHAPRGIGKTLAALSIAVAVSSGGTFLRWNAPKPEGVLYIDGEMPAATMQERLGNIIDSNDKKPLAPLRIITPDLQSAGMPNLSTMKGQKDIEPHLEGVSLVIVDNISTLCRSGRENEAESWLPVQEWALKLRSLGFSILFIHHAGKDGNQRGTSRREDVLDTVINLKRPGDYRPAEGARFEIHFEKGRSMQGDDVEAFEAKLIASPDGPMSWDIEDLEDSLTEKVANLLNEGTPQSKIPELLGVSKSTVSKHKTKARLNGLLKKDI